MSKKAFVFPGQGAQFAGMGKLLYDTSAAAKEIFCKVEKIRKGTLEQCFDGPLDVLSLTINTQPCLFAVSLASAESLREGGTAADAVAGFSVGEIAALTYAEVFSFEDGFGIVCKRAQLMHAAAESHKASGNAGAMAAVLRISAEKTEELCKASGVYAVNFNCPMQTVVAGESSKMAEFGALVAENGGRVMPLAVSGAFHSPFMDGAAAEFAQYLKSIHTAPPKIPVYANYSGLRYEAAPDSQQNKQLMAQQINNPVLWQKTIENMVSDGITEFVETQPGKVLTGLISKIIVDNR